MAQFKPAPTDSAGSLITTDPGQLSYLLHEPVVVIGILIVLAALLAKVMQGLFD